MCTCPGAAFVCRPLAQSVDRNSLNKVCVITVLVPSHVMSNILWSFARMSNTLWDSGSPHRHLSEYHTVQHHLVSLREPGQHFLVALCCRCISPFAMFQCRASSGLGMFGLSGLEDLRTWSGTAYGLFALSLNLDGTLSYPGGGCGD